MMDPMEMMKIPIVQSVLQSMMNVCLKTPKAIVSALSIGLLGAVLSLTKLGFYFEEEWGLSWLFGLRGPMVAPDDVTIVTIDKSSADSLHLPENPEKWPRAYYAALIEQLNRHQPAMIAFNIYFGEVRDVENDVRLAQAMAANKNVILSSYLKQYTFPAANASDEFKYERIIGPIAVLNQAALASAPFPLPKSSSTVKQFWTYKKSAGNIPTFPVTVFQCYALRTAYPEISALIQRFDPELASTLPKTFERLAAESEPIETIEKIQGVFAAYPWAQLNDALESAYFSPEKTRLIRSWFSLSNGEDSLYFNHYGKAGTIRTVPFHRILAGGGGNSVLFSHKVVLIGYSENIEPEKIQGFYTDFSGDHSSTLSSTEMAATAIANLIEDDWLKPLSIQNQCLLALAWSCLLLSVCRLFAYREASFLLFGLSLGYAGYAYFRFAADDIWLPVFIPIFIQMPLAWFLITFSYFKKQKRERHNIYTAFSFYLPDAVVNRIAYQADPDSLKDYGELMQGVCMATDAGQYTTLSETMDPAMLAALMNQYYGVMFPLVKNHDGIISDVIGDAMLAIWAAPMIESPLRSNACLAALEIKRAIDRFNKAQPYQLPTRMGLHSGEMHLGNVGTVEHYEYRAVGDMVNTTVRIEGLNKLLGTHILVSSNVIEGLAGFFVREVGVFILKGKTMPVRLFELIAPLAEAEAKWESLVSSFTRALKLFQCFQWSEALEAFVDINTRFPEDGPTRFYIGYLRQSDSFAVEKTPGEQQALIEIGNITKRLHS
ncbi:MAG: CHASE2 domain-containing protein [Gammaproteobacteria bacterium]